MLSVIENKRPYGVFTLLNGQWYHKGASISEADKKTLEKQFERVIELSPTIIGNESSANQQAG